MPMKRWACCTKGVDIKKRLKSDLAFSFSLDNTILALFLILPQSPYWPCYKNVSIFVIVFPLQVLDGKQAWFNDPKCNDLVDKWPAWDFDIFLIEFLFMNFFEGVCFFVGIDNEEFEEEHIFIVFVERIKDDILLFEFRLIAPIRNFLFENNTWAWRVHIISKRLILEKGFSFLLGGVCFNGVFELAEVIYLC